MVLTDAVEAFSGVSSEGLSVLLVLGSSILGKLDINLWDYAGTNIIITQRGLLSFGTIQGLKSFQYPKRLLSFGTIRGL